MDSLKLLVDLACPIASRGCLHWNLPALLVAPRVAEGTSARMEEER